MFIYIARHAWAGEHGDPRWPDDSQRPLTPEGSERYDEVIKSLVKRGFAPERIATSPYVRCRQTADIISRRVPGVPKIIELEALEPGSYFDLVIEWTNEQGGVDVCWVGHSPDVERFTAMMIGDSSATIRFAKGAVAAIECDREVIAGGGELYWLATAKLLGV
ncbi:MAG: histidine phosphatase family protein [Pirellulales bacterium]